jgi:hypothetical protein
MAIHQDSSMKNSKRRLLGATVLAATCLPSLAWSANCQWVPAGGPTMKNYQRDMGTLYVPRDASPGTVIGAIDLPQTTSSNPGSIPHHLVGVAVSQRRHEFDLGKNLFVLIRVDQFVVNA